MFVRALRVSRWVAAASAWIAAEAARAQHLYLYPAPFPSEQVWPNAISADGSVVVGRMQIHPFTSPASDRAAQWRPATGGFGDRFLPDHLEIGRSEATGVSEDGGVIAGNVTVGTRNNVFVKTPQGISLPNPFENEPYGGPGTGIQLAQRGCVSADGEWIAGRAGTNSADFSEYTTWAFRMRPSGFAETIRLITFPDNGPGTGNFAIPWAISADGRHLVGREATSRDSAWHWGPGIDDVYALADSATAVATSANGNVFAVDVQFSSPFSTHVALVGGPNQGVLANPFGADHMYCTSMSADGQTVCGTWQNQSNTQGGGWIWKPTTGMVEAVNYFATFPELDVSMFDWMQVYAISMDGMVLAGYGFTTQGYFRAFTIDLRKDSDGDGLFDHWETDGVPYISSFDGVRRLMLPGANPLRKDIYVEIDTMQGMGPSQVALQRVRDAFDSAPVPAPNVPGGLPGIALHAEVDDDYIPVSLTPFDVGLYQVHRAQYFGTAEQRDDEFDYERILKVKKQIYRYCFFSRTIVAGNLGAAEVTGELNEFGERYGSDDMMIGLGAYTPVPGTTLDDIYASTFMHELGHTLGLWHGGTSPTQNYNPNHYSVMNYTWSGVRNFGPLAQTPHLHLDYSRGPLNVLNEDLLFEFEGIGGNPNIRVPIVVRASITEGLCLEPPTNHGVCHRTNEQNILYTCVNFVPMGGPVDWDNDRIISRDDSVCADANGLFEHSYHDIMESCNEWDLIAYSFKGSPLATGAFLSGLGNNPCPTEAQEIYLATLPPPPPDDPCTGLPPNVSTPTPASASSCGEATVTFSVDYAGAGPGFSQWRWWNAALPVPNWVDFSEGEMPGGTVVTDSTGGTLTLQAARIADFGGSSVLISCRITDACGLSSDSPPCTLVLGEVSAEIASAGGGACPGGSVEFSVSAAAESEPISYEWVAYQSNTLILENGVMPHGTLVQGADTNTLRLSNVAWPDFEGAEWTALACRVSNGCSAVEVGPFHFSAMGVGIIRHPDMVSLGCEGAAGVVFSTEAVAAAPATFRWTKNGVPLVNDGRVTGADTPTLTIAPPMPSDSAHYACVVSGVCGSATTDPARFYFGPPLLERDPPFVVPVCMGSTANLRVQPLGTLFSTAQWMRNGVDIVNDERHYGANTWSLTIVGTEPADFAASFSVRLQNSCGTFVSQAASIPEYQPIEFAAQPQSRSICAGGVATLTAPPVVEQGSFVIWQVENPTDPNSWSDVWGNGPLPDVGDCWLAQFPAPYTIRLWPGVDFECPSSLRFRCIHYAACDGFVLSDVATVRVCCGDANGDGSVSLTDLSLLLAAFGASSGDAGYHAGADLNSSGTVDLSDLSVLLANFGASCP